MISIPKLDFSMKINISIHNWSSKKICSIRYTQYVHISFWTLREWLYKRLKNSRRRPLCWGLKDNHILRVQNEVCTYWVYLMEHISFELHLCTEISIFKEMSNFACTDHPEITPSLELVSRRLDRLAWVPYLRLSRSGSWDNHWYVWNYR